MWLHKAVFVLAGLSIPSTLLGEETSWIFPLLLLAAGSCAALAFLMEMSATVRYVAARTWRHPLGKAAYALVVYVGALVSTSMAKHIAHEVTGVNPSGFNEFVPLMAGISTIFFFLVLVQVLLVFLAVVFLIQGLLLMIMDMVAGVFSNSGRRLVPLMLRVLTGRKEKRSKLTLGIFSMSMFVGAMVVLGLVSAPFHAVARSPQALERFFSQAIVLTEYRRRTACADINPSRPVTYVNKDTISVAVWDESTQMYEFTIDKCMYETGP